MTPADSRKSYFGSEADKYEILFNSIDEGFAIIEIIFNEVGNGEDYRFLETNRAFEQDSGVPNAKGKTLLEIFPGMEASWAGAFGEVVKTGKPKRFEDYSPEVDRWVSVFAARLGSPENKQVAVIFSDITRRKRRELNNTFLSEIQDDLASLNTTEEIMHTVGQKLGEYMNIATAYFVEIDESVDQGRFYYIMNNAGSPFVPPVIRLSDFINEDTANAFRNGETVIISDTQNDDRVSAVAMAALDIYSAVVVPFHRNEEWRFVLAVSDNKMRVWRSDEVDVFRELANRFFPRLERAQAEEALVASKIQLAKELADTKLLQEVSARLIEEDDAQLLYEQVVFAAKAMMHSDMASFQMMNQDRNALFLLGSSGFHPEAEAHWQWVEIDDGTSCAKATALRERVIIEDVMTNAFIADQERVYFSLCGIRGVQSTPLISRSGQFIGMISTHWRKEHLASEKEFMMFDVLARLATDLLERKQAGEALRKSEERLKLAVKAANIGTFIWYVAEDRTEPDPQFLRHFGLPENGIINLQIALRSMIHPEDVPGYAIAVAAACDVNGPGVLHEDFRISLPDGSIRWISINGQVYFSENPRTALHMVGTAIDISDQKALEQQKDDFIAVASHELKTLLTSIKAFAELLLERFEHQQEDSNIKMMHKLNMQVDRLAQLIRDLLDTTRISEGRLQLRAEQFHLGSLILERAEEMQHTTAKHQIIFNDVILPEIYGDRERIGQVITNLLSNAVKYSPDGGKVEIRMEPENGYIKVLVRDEGVGITPELQHKVFDRFFRINDAQMRTFPGMGLGLYISSGIIQRHRGSIGVMSKPGEGATFYFTIPAVPVS
ncbi:ATP-binding protein [Taibaiella soli]|uniref:histidine kinase n=1 Tax=Taibaiella soli TaxID=1649169 RepID=A0A2W2AU00_9BACT|nr:ATP-binding protein [Taibaiella soli]PZF71188.1 hypothetical protein DN068_19635 [Taibaiella soli]